MPLGSVLFNNNFITLRTTTFDVSKLIGLYESILIAAEGIPAAAPSTAAATVPE